MSQQRVGDAELVVEDEREQHALDRRRDHDGHEGERPVEADQPDAAVEQQREPEPAARC